MKHLRKFELETDYLQAKDSFVYPTVSYIVEKGLLHYMKKSNYEFVDLGLPSGLKWAAWNVGAKKPEDSGLYFAWGEDKGYVATCGEPIVESFGIYNAIITNADGSETTKKFKDNYSDYKYYENGKITKYNDDDKLTKLENEDDGCYLTEKEMRMPTKDECRELIENTTSAWTENYNGSGINGVTLTSKKDGNSNSIFIPAVGDVNGKTLVNFGLSGYFWSSYPNYSSIDDTAFCLDFESDYLGVTSIIRSLGIPLRAVRP